MVATFPYAKSLPDTIYYDRSCFIAKYLQSQGYTYFEENGCYWLVDNFHAQKSHNDDFCTKTCNSARLPELADTNGRSIFNTSACEQVNAWFGKFQPVCREMLKDRYNFYLDEMILLRNEWMVAELKRKGHGPYLIPLKSLGVPEASS